MLGLGRDIRFVNDAPSSPPRRGLAPELRLTLVAIAGVVAFGIGLWAVSGTDLGFTPGGVVAGVAGQLGSMLPAAAAVLAVTAANVVMGAVLLRMVRGLPFGSLSELLLGGFVGAVLADTAMLMILGSIGLFRWPIILGAHLAVFVAAWWFQPLLVRSARGSPGIPTAAWLLVGLVWLGPVILALSSPVAPFLDVLPNHVAPVEHLRTFGSFEALNTSPSPIYATSRLFVGFVSVLGTISTLTGLPAGTAVAAFGVPMTLLLGLGVQELARALFGRSAAYWALLTLPLSVVFLRLPDARATVLVYVPLAWTLAFLYRGTGSTGPRTTACLAAGIAASLLVHPLMGGFGLLTIAMLVLAQPGRFAFAVPAVVAGGALGIPQAAVMAGVEIPSWAGLAAIPVALAGGWLTARISISLLRLLRPLAAAGLVIAVLVLAPQAVPNTARWIGDLLANFPVLTATAILALTLGLGRGRWALLASASLTVVIAAAGTGILPSDSRLVEALRFEIPKTLGYWTSCVLALAAAAGLRDLWRSRGWTGPMGPALVVIFVVVAALPLRAEPLGVNEHKEYRYSESASITLRHAQNGYWVGFPDPRQIVNAEQIEILNAIRREHAEGRLTAQTELLHIASSFQQWSSTPVGVFTGVIETDATLDPEHSVLTEGGRLRHVDEVALLLAEEFAYVLLEPAGLPSDFRPQIEAAGYRSIFANQRGELFRREN